MKKDLTDITVVLDRSGSMALCREDAEGGLNSFVKEQREQSGDAVFTLVHFDHEYEFVHKAIQIKDVPSYRLIPRGTTALLDAVGRAITETGERLKAIPEENRPGLVVFVIITDGQENSSKEYNRDKIKEMIETQQSIYKWQFTYLGANQNAFAEGAAMGMARHAVANYVPSNTGAAFGAASKNVGRMRSATASDKPVASSYTDEERKSMDE